MGGFAAPRSDLKQMRVNGRYLLLRIVQVVTETIGCIPGNIKVE